jgi:hypothetical protein
VRTVAGRLGHANAAMTLGVYAHVLEQADQEVAESLARTLDPTLPSARGWVGSSTPFPLVGKALFADAQPRVSPESLLFRRIRA